MSNNSTSLDRTNGNYSILVNQPLQEKSGGSTYRYMCLLVSFYQKSWKVLMCILCGCHVTVIHLQM